MANIKDEKDLFGRVLEKDAPSPPAKPADGAALRALSVLQAQITTELGVKPMPSEAREALVAVTRATDVDTDRAYGHFLTLDSDVAAGSVAAPVFESLSDLDDALASLEAATAAGAAGFLQVVRDQDLQNQAWTDLIARLGARSDEPADREFLPGLSLGAARVLFASALSAYERGVRSEKQRDDRARRLREQKDREVQASQRALAEEESVARLRQQARGALPGRKGKKKEATP